MWNPAASSTFSIITVGIEIHYLDRSRATPPPTSGSLFLMQDRNPSTSLKGLKFRARSYFRAARFWILMSPIELRINRVEEWERRSRRGGGQVVVLASLWADVRGLPKHLSAYFCIRCLAPSRCWWALSVGRIYILVNPNRCMLNKAWQVNSLF